MWRSRSRSVTWQYQNDQCQTRPNRKQRRELAKKKREEEAASGADSRDKTPDGNGGACTHRGMHRPQRRRRRRTPQPTAVLEKQKSTRVNTTKARPMATRANPTAAPKATSKAKSASIKRQKCQRQRRQTRRQPRADGGRLRHCKVGHPNCGCHAALHNLRQFHRANVGAQRKQ